MPLSRFFIYWLLDYIVALTVVYTLTTAGRAVFDMPSLAYVSLLFIPTSTLFFSWLAYRGVESESAHRGVIALRWVLLAMLVDVIVAVAVYHISLANFLFSPLVIGTYGSKFLAVFVGAYLGVTVSRKADTLLPRSS